MRNSMLSLFLLAALSSFGETIEYQPCVDERPESAYDRPLCAEHSLNQALIAAAESGDASALALLEQRYASTETYGERHRLAEVLLRRVADDSAIWNEIHANAQLAVRFADDSDGLDRWCEERGYDPIPHMSMLENAFEVAVSDPRSRALLVKALDLDHRYFVVTAIGALAAQRDVASLPAIDEAISMLDTRDVVDAVGMLAEFHDERADAIAKKHRYEEEETDAP